MIRRENKFLKLFMIFLSSEGRLVSTLQPAWKLGNFACMPGYTVSAPRSPGSQCPPNRHENPSGFFSFCCFNGWFSAFRSSCIEELGSSCNTSFKVIYLAKLTISVKINFHPAIIAGYIVPVFAERLILTHHGQHCPIYS